MTVIGNAIAAEAETWVDTPFVDTGQIKGVGADCKGLLAGVAAACGRPEAASVEALAADYNLQNPVNERRLRSGLVRLFDRVPHSSEAPADRRPGDVLLVKCRGRAQHLAIATPLPGRPLRVIEAQLDVMKVRPFRRSDAEIDSVWRWRDLPEASSSSEVHGCAQGALRGS